MAIHLLLCPLRLRTLRQRLDDLCLPIRSRRCIFSRLVLAHLGFRLLLHCPVRGRTRLRLPYIRRTILYMQIPCAGQLGAGDFMAVWLVEPDRSDCRSCFYRVRLRSTTASSRLNGRRFQGLCADRPSDGRGHGRVYRPPWFFEQSEHSSTGKDDQNICHFPHCCPLQLLRRAFGNVRLQAYVLLHMDHGCQQLGLVSHGLVLPLRLLVSLMDHDRLRCDGPYRRRNQRSRNQSTVVHCPRARLHLDRRLAVHHRAGLLQRRSQRHAGQRRCAARSPDLLRRHWQERRHLLHRSRLFRSQLHGHDSHPGRRPHHLGLRPRRNAPPVASLVQNQQENRHPHLRRVAVRRIMYAHQPDRSGLLHRHIRNLQSDGHRSRLVLLHPHHLQDALWQV